MSINLNKFSPRPGLVNKQGRLPDPSELVCVEVPKVFDQCLIKRCLVYDIGPDTSSTDAELRSDALPSIKRYIGSRDFSLHLISVEKIPLLSDSNYKKIIISYMISFNSDYVDDSGNTRTELFEVTRTDVIGKFYWPDSIAQISANYLEENENNDADLSRLKLEMVAEALAGNLNSDENGNYLDITLGYYIVVKSSLTVQLLIPAYAYTPVPTEPCEEEEEEDPCERFENAPIPSFYPEQNLQPLFLDNDDFE